jgi:hypothetical protein
VCECACACDCDCVLCVAPSVDGVAAAPPVAMPALMSIADDDEEDTCARLTCVDDWDMLVVDGRFPSALVLMAALALVLLVAMALEGSMLMVISVELSPSMDPPVFPADMELSMDTDTLAEAKLVEDCPAAAAADADADETMSMSAAAEVESADADCAPGWWSGCGGSDSTPLRQRRILFVVFAAFLIGILTILALIALLFPQCR